MDWEEESRKYLDMLTRMRRACVKGYVAPHKPVLLLAVQYLIETGWINDNRIVLDKRLENTFEQFWNVMVDNGRSDVMIVSEDIVLAVDNVYPFNCKIANPFYHLSNEAFWTLVKNDQWQPKSVYSLRLLRKYYEYAEIDWNLFELMKKQPYNDRIRGCLESMI